jgi:hypothetical protein
MNITSRLSVHLHTVVLLASSLLVASTSAAMNTTYTSVSNGATLQWAGSSTNVNVLDLAYGSGWLVGSDGGSVLFAGPGDYHISITGNGNIITKGTGVNATFCTDTSGSQGATTAYYVYYAGYSDNNSTLFTPVISVDAPGSDGSPGGTGISFTFNSHSVTNSNSGIFVGSYITDSNSAMIPFSRSGEEVILTPTCDGSSGFCSVMTVEDVFKPTVPTPPPRADELTWSGGAIPQSATALIVNVFFTNTDTKRNFAYIVNPLDPGVAGVAPACKIQPQFSAYMSAGISDAYWQHLRVKTNINNQRIDVAGCTDPNTGAKYTMDVMYVGYVEPVHHLSEGKH